MGALFPRIAFDDPEGREVRAQDHGAVEAFGLDAFLDDGIAGGAGFLRRGGVVGVDVGGLGRVDSVLAVAKVMHAGADAQPGAGGERQDG